MMGRFFEHNIEQIHQTEIIFLIFLREIFILDKSESRIITQLTRLISMFIITNMDR